MVERQGLEILEGAGDRSTALGGPQVRAVLNPVRHASDGSAKHACNGTEDGGYGEEVGCCEGGDVHVGGS